MPHDAADAGEQPEAVKAAGADAPESTKAEPAKPAAPELPPEIAKRLEAAEKAQARLAELEAEREKAEAEKLSEKEREEKALAKLREEKAALMVENACVKAGVTDDLREFVTAPDQAPKLMGAVEKIVAQRVKDALKGKAQEGRINPPSGEGTGTTDGGERKPRRLRSNPFADQMMGRKAS